MVEGKARESKPICDRHKLFALEYLANGRNATQAYQFSHPKCRSKNAAGVEGSRLLRNPKVAAFIAERTKETLQDLSYRGEQALKGIASFAQADIRQLLNDDGTVKPTAEWPEAAADAVKSVQVTRFGLKVTIVDKLAARILIVKAAGMLKADQPSARRVTLGMLLSDDPLPADPAAF